jgi:hypothetical protein
MALHRFLFTECFGIQKENRTFATAFEVHPLDAGHRVMAN